MATGNDKKPADLIVRQVGGLYYVSTLKDGVPVNLTKGFKSSVEANAALMERRKG